MSIVPKQIEVDDEVISYWLKKLMWTREEFACLYCGINPLGYKQYNANFGYVELRISSEKNEQIEDVQRVVRDMLETHRSIVNSPIKWRELTKEVGLSPMDWLEQIPDTIAASEKNSLTSETADGNSQRLSTDGNPHATVVVRNSTKSKRRDILTPVIEKAQSTCQDPSDTAEVWATLQILAEEKQAPLIGGTEDGLQYLENGTAKIFKRDSLRKRLDR